MARAAETEEQRSKRHRQRTLFDAVARLYQATRPGYPAEIVESLAATAGIGPGSPVLEVGCGTGQLTGDLSRYAFDLTAIDIGPVMIAAARQQLADAAISFQACSFEDFAATDSSFDLIVSATAFHWVDPEVKFSKSARLLRPGGWLALLAIGERYDDPLNAALGRMWTARSEDKAWSARKPPADSRCHHRLRPVRPAPAPDAPAPHDRARRHCPRGGEHQGDHVELASRCPRGVHRGTAQPSWLASRGHAHLAHVANDGSGPVVAARVRTPANDEQLGRYRPQERLPY